MGIHPLWCYPWGKGPLGIPFFAGTIYRLVTARLQQAKEYMFVGTHERSVDEKGRFALPSTFRGDVGSHAYLVNLGSCLAIMNSAQVTKTLKRLEKKIRNNDEPQSAMRVFTAGMSELKVDSQGRVVVPAGYRTAADISDTMTLVGAFTRIELYAPERWNALAPSDDDMTNVSWL